MKSESQSWKNDQSSGDRPPSHITGERKEGRTPIVVAFLLAGLIFSVDLVTPLGVAAGVPYVAVILLTPWLGEKRYTRDAAIGVTLLTALGFLLSPPGGVLWMVLFNRGLAIFAIWVTAILILKRKRAEEGLLDSAERRRAIVDTAYDVIITIDSDGAIESFNPAGEEVFGYTASEVIGKNVKLLMPEPHKSRHDGFIKSYLESGKGKLICRVGEFEARRKDGTSFPIELSVSEVQVGNRRIITGVIRDITERNRAEQLNMRLGRILNQSSSEIYVFDLQTLKFIQANEGGLNNLGYTMEELAELTPLDLKPEFTWETFQDLIEPLRGEREERISFETVHLRKDGSTYPVEVRLEISRKESDPVLIAIIQDITERKNSEEALRSSEERLTLAGSTHGLWDWNIETNEYFFSSRFRQLLGFQAHEFRAVRESFTTLLHPDDYDRTQQAIVDHLENRVPYDVEYRLRTKSGEYLWLGARGQAVWDDSGKPVRMAGTVTEISDRKQAEEELGRYAETQAVLLKEVNHRVTNNLATIISLIHKEDLGSLTGEPETSSPALRDLERRVRGLSTVHGMLSASAWRPLALADLCERVIGAALRGVPRSKPLEIHVQPSAIKVNSDQAHHLALVLNELATNVLKHVLGGRDSARIDIGLEEEDETLHIRFHDDGPGYPEEMLNEDLSKAGIGWELIQGIVTTSLRGQVGLENKDGAVATISFKRIDHDDEGEG